MKILYKVTLSPPGEIYIKADGFYISDVEALIFVDYFGDDDYSDKRTKAMFAPGQWVCAERIYEGGDEESENAANYELKKEKE